MGHEAIGVVESVGSQVRRSRPRARAVELNAITWTGKDGSRLTQLINLTAMHGFTGTLLGHSEMLATLSSEFLSKCWV